jgi:chromosomal replication initiator protein
MYTFSPYVIVGMNNYYSVDIIISKICKYYDVEFAQLLKKNRKQTFVKPRQMICYFLRKKTNLTLKEIGYVFKQDHTTAMHNINLIEDFITINDEITLNTIKVINELFIIRNNIK